MKIILPVIDEGDPNRPITTSIELKRLGERKDLFTMEFFVDSKEDWDQTVRITLDTSEMLEALCALRGKFQ